MRAIVSSLAFAAMSIAQAQNPYYNTYSDVKALWKGRVSIHAENKASDSYTYKDFIYWAHTDRPELNEAFAAQVLSCTRSLGLSDNDPRINPNGGAIALGHPLGMSGARLLQTAALELKATGKRYALCTMCIGVGQGYATIIERC